MKFMNEQREFWTLKTSNSITGIITYNLGKMSELIKKMLPPPVENLEVLILKKLYFN